MEPKKRGRPKGTPKTGGRPPGGVNKATREAREAIGLFVDGNAHRLQGWLDAIADGKKDDENKFVVLPNPVKAFELFQSVIEYHVPKLARTELTGKDGENLPAPATIIIQS
jgi:hypothetical protein